ELLTRGVHLPALRRRIRLLEEPAMRAGEPDGAVRAVEYLVLAAVRVRERRLIGQDDAVVPVHAEVDRVRHAAAVPVQADRARALDADGWAPAQEGEDVDLVRGELAREPDRDVRVQPPVEGALERAVRRWDAPARFAVVLRVEGDDVSYRIAPDEEQRAPVDRIRAREQ